jgi:hypothetical protein
LLLVDSKTLSLTIVTRPRISKPNFCGVLSIGWRFMLQNFRFYQTFRPQRLKPQWMFSFTHRNVVVGYDNAHFVKHQILLMGHGKNSNTSDSNWNHSDREVVSQTIEIKEESFNDVSSFLKLFLIRLLVEDFIIWLFQITTSSFLRKSLIVNKTLLKIFCFV